MPGADIAQPKRPIKEPVGPPKVVNGPGDSFKTKLAKVFMRSKIKPGIKIATATSAQKTIALNSTIPSGP
jgi:hypothetical protein